MARFPQEIFDATLAFLGGLTPAALGAAVSLAYEKGLTWTDRFVQFAVGVVVSWFASRSIGAVWSLDPFVLQGVTFTLGMIAFKATPKFVASVIEAIADPTAFLPFLKKKDPGA